MTQLDASAIHEVLSMFLFRSLHDMHFCILHSARVKPRPQRPQDAVAALRTYLLAFLAMPSLTVPRYLSIRYLTLATYLSILR